MKIDIFKNNRQKKHVVGNWEAYILIKNKDLSLILALLRSGSLDPNLKFRGTSLITAAIQSNSIEILKVLLENGGDPNIKSCENDREEPPLITATRFKNLEAVKLLIQNSASVLSTNIYGENVYYQAVNENAFEILEYLLQNVPVNKRKGSCALKRALADAESYLSKRKSLYILLKHCYECSCQKSHKTNYNNNCLITITKYKNKDVKTFLYKLVYELAGINLNLIISLNQRDHNTRSLVEKIEIHGGATEITLMGLVRIKIRKEALKMAAQNHNTFISSIRSILPLLPSSLQAYLLLDNLVVI